jgi:hypothetical protein
MCPLQFFSCWRFHWLFISCCCNIFARCIHKVFPRLFRVKQQFKMPACLDCILLVSYEHSILVVTEIRTVFKAYLLNVLISLYAICSFPELNSSPILRIFSVTCFLFFLRQILCTCLFCLSNSCFFLLVRRARYR